MQRNTSASRFTTWNSKDNKKYQTMINIHDWMHEANASVIFLIVIFIFFKLQTDTKLSLNTTGTTLRFWKSQKPVTEMGQTVFFVLCACASLCVCVCVCACVHVLCYVCVCVCVCVLYYVACVWLWVAHTQTLVHLYLHDCVHVDLVIKATFYPRSSSQVNRDRQFSSSTQVGENWEEAKQGLPTRRPSVHSELFKSF